jgi:hypothetical protein
MELLGLLHQLNRPGVITTWLLVFLIAGAGCLAAIARENRNGTSLRSRDFATARTYWRNAWQWPESVIAKIAAGVMILLIVTISLVVFLHAIGEPETYWDSLILYMGYARLMFIEHGFPIKITGQVGIGLGANYPHLYALLTAQSAALCGFWDDAFAQLLPPCFSLSSILLAYAVVVAMTESQLAGIASALIIRAVPYGMAYGQFASDYAVAIGFTAAFIYLAFIYIRRHDAGSRNLMFLVAAGAVHINYLMLVLWPVAGLIVLAAHFRPVLDSAWPETNAADLPNSHTPGGSDDFDEKDACNIRYGSREPNQFKMSLEKRPFLPPAALVSGTPISIMDLLRQPSFWMGLLPCALLASTWFIRNTLLTGNPVYAFYYKIFPSLHVNPAVMKSAEVEWLRNGDGLGRAGSTLAEKLANSWTFFVTGGTYWKLSPVLIGWVLPGIAAWLVLIVFGRSAQRPRADSRPTWFPALVYPNARALNIRFTWCIFSLFVLLWYYAYAIADFYLYQIIIVIPLFAVFVAWLFLLCKEPGCRGAICLLAIFTGLMPGVTMGLMGFKLKHTGVYEGMPPPQTNLTALRMLFMDKSMYYRMEFDGDMEMIGRINQLPAGTAVLTHENRFLLLNPRLNIICLDDWDVQKAYHKPAPERIRILDSLGIRYYLYVPNEDNHEANSWLGMSELIRDGYFKLDYKTKSSGTSRSDSDHTVIPSDANVLYKRTDKK